MSDEAATTETVEPTAEETQPEVVEPTAEEAEVVAEEPEAPSHTLDATIGVAPAQTFGPERPSNVSSVEETFLTTDRVITDHSDPLATKYQFLGQSAPAPLPAGGATGDQRKPEQVFAAAGQ